MKSSKRKIFPFILITFFLLLSLPLLSLLRHQKTFNPMSDKSNFYDQLNLALKTSHLQTSSWVIRDFINQIEFTVKSDNNSFKVILSDQKNPVTQIASLQQLLKTAKMKEQPLKLVDLSTTHPYATFKNN